VAYPFGPTNSPRSPLGKECRLETVDSHLLFSISHRCVLRSYVFHDVLSVSLSVSDNMSEPPFKYVDFDVSGLSPLWSVILAGDVLCVSSVILKNLLIPD